jgi:homocysteine S-methyltransferase
LGIRIEPLGKTSFEETRASFREQIAALVEGGVDLLMLETFGYLDELNQAVLACRDVDPKIPIIAQVTIDEDGNCLDGSDPEAFAARLTEWKVDVAGINCSVGPVAMLDAIERVRALTPLPLAAQPNAGMPRSVEGRNIYLCSPEYMASYTRKFVAAGVQLVGGCCGTTPDHIRAMKSALRAQGARSGGRCAIDSGQYSDGRTVPLGRQAIRRRLRHHGRDRAAEGHRYPERDRGCQVRQVGRRGRGKYSR